MSYLVLARKYRPQTFEDIVGQKHITQTLSNAIRSDRVHHAFLFTGTRGVGKTTAARIMAKALNCEEGPTPTPCNKCKSCISITNGSSVDVFEIDGASNTGVDDVRDLRENVRFMPQFSKYKIYIIDEVHMLSTSAFNALLKTLEEPPPHVIFIFATTEPHKIPETVHSRCQQYDFKMIPQRMILEHLKNVVESEKVNIDENGLRLIARKAEGSMRDAMSYLDQTFSYGGDTVGTKDLMEILGIVDREVFLDLSKCIIEGKTSLVLEVMDRLRGTTWDIKQFYGDLLEHFRNLVVAKVSEKPEDMIDASTEEISELSTQVKTPSITTLQNLFTSLVNNEDLVIRSAYPKLVLEMTLLKMAHNAPVADLDELVEKLATIKKALEEGGPLGAPFPPKKDKKPEKSLKPVPPKPPTRKQSDPGKIELPKPGKKTPLPEKKEVQPPPDKKNTVASGDLSKRFLAFLREQEPMLVNFFQDATLVEQTETALAYEIPNGAANMVEAHKGRINEVILTLAGPDGTVKIIPLEKDHAEKAQKRRKKQQAEDEKLLALRKESRKNKAVSWIIEEFDDPDMKITPLKDNN